MTKVASELFPPFGGMEVVPARSIQQEIRPTHGANTMIYQSSHLARQAAALEAKDTMVGSLYRAIRGPDDACATGGQREGHGEDRLDDLATAICVFANALRDLGVTQADATAEVARTVTVPFARHHRCSLIALARACCAVVYETPTAGLGGRPALREAKWLSRLLQRRD